MQDWLSGAARPVAARLERSRVNLWAVVGLLALAGWLVDSGLVAVELHRLPGAGPWVHLEHLWYGPLLLLAALAITRPGLRRVTHWGENLVALEELARDLRPEVKHLAGQVTGSETKVAVLAFYWRQPRTALTAVDLAYQTGRQVADVEPAVADLGALGLVEAQRACDLTFYRLTSNRRRLAQLDELMAWQESWLERARRIRVAVGPSLLQQDGHK